MNEVKVPPRLQQLLGGDRGLEASVSLTLKHFEPWLGSSGMPFFPGYTNHDADHISEVLATASSLVTDSAWENLSAADAAVLIVAVLLHDSGMHLTEDGFRYLVSSKSDQLARLDGFGDRPWCDLWQEYLSEASRFDGRQLTAIFGNPLPVDPRQVDISNLSERDRLLVGEFVRKHHARLAHEIAVFGVPGPGPDRLVLKMTGRDLEDLSGLVARSHGLSMRDTFQYLRDKYDLRAYRDVHAVFLMSLVRIADYVQVQAERAPQELLRIKELRSPISRSEWHAHSAVRDIRGNHEDPEALFVDAIPGDVATYLKLRRLFSSIQRELDSSWAVLGEVYGRFGALRELGLSIRRLRSSLDDEAAFERKVDYLPVAASFEAAGTDLLKLLVGPLYGGDISVGVRELVQNAVDACREIADWGKQRGGPAIDSYDQHVNVLVRVFRDAEGARRLEVTDKGIGMTPDVVRNFFLKAGASFRYSESWRKEHEGPDGRPRVTRGGRFGVGALAAFLLGPKMRVTTRHVTQPPDAALTFEATLEATSVELRWTRAPVGTRIEIELNEEAWDALKPDSYRLAITKTNDVIGGENWGAVDWYCLETPAVRVEFQEGEETRSLTPRYRLPAAGAPLGRDWQRLEAPDYEDVQWALLNAKEFLFRH